MGGNLCILVSRLPPAQRPGQNGEFLDVYGAVPGIVTFFIGLIFIVGIGMYGVTTTAPAAWFAHLSATEGKYFRAHMLHAHEPLSIHHFVSLERRYHHHGMTHHTSLKDQLNSIS